MLLTTYICIKLIYMLKARLSDGLVLCEYSPDSSKIPNEIRAKIK